MFPKQFSHAIPNFTKKTIVPSLNLQSTFTPLPYDLVDFDYVGELCVLDNGDVVFVSVESGTSKQTLRRYFASSQTVVYYLGAGDSTADGVDSTKISSSVSFIRRTSQGECAFIDDGKVKVISNIDNTVRTLFTYSAAISFFSYDENHNMFFVTDGNAVFKVNMTGGIMNGNITVIAGTSTAGSGTTLPADRSVANATNLRIITSVVSSGDGTVYLISYNALLKIENGLLYKVAGGWSSPCSVSKTSNILAINSCLFFPKLLAVYDNEIYFKDTPVSIRKITRDKYSVLLAGTGSELINTTRTDQKLFDIKDQVGVITTIANNGTLPFYFSTRTRIFMADKDYNIKPIIGRAGEINVKYSLFQYGMNSIEISKIFKIFRNGDYLLVLAADKTKLWRLSIKTGVLQVYHSFDFQNVDAVIDKSTNQDIYIVQKSINSYRISKFNIYTKNIQIIAGTDAHNNGYQYDGQSSLDVAINKYSIMKYFNGSIYYSTQDQYKIIQVDLTTLTVKYILGTGYPQGFSISGLYSNLANVDIFPSSSALISNIASSQGILYLKIGYMLVKIDNQNKVLPHIGTPFYCGSTISGSPLFNNYPSPADKVLFGGLDYSLMAFHPETNNLFFTAKTSTDQSLLEYVNSTYVRKVFDSKSINSLAFRKNGNIVYSTIEPNLYEYNITSNNNTKLLSNINSACVTGDDKTIAFITKSGELGFYTFSNGNSTLTAYSFKTADYASSIYCIPYNNQVYYSVYQLKNVTNGFLGTIGPGETLTKILSGITNGVLGSMTFHNGSVFVVTGSGTVLSKFNNVTGEFTTIWDGNAHGRKREMEYQPLGYKGWNIDENGDIYFVNANSGFSPMQKVLRSQRLVVEVVGNGTEAAPTFIKSSALSDPTKDGSFVADITNKLWYDPTSDRYFPSDAIATDSSSFSKDEDLTINSKQGSYYGIDTFQVKCERDKYDFCLQNFTCFGIFYNDPAACNGQGECTSFDECECFDDSFYGDCSTNITCFGVKANNETVCNGIGICITQDLCQNSTNDLKSNSSIYTNFTSENNSTDFGNNTSQTNSSNFGNYSSDSNSTFDNSTITNSSTLNSTTLNTTLNDNSTTNNETVFNSTTLNSTLNDNSTTNNETVFNSTNISNNSLIINETNYSNSTDNSTNNTSIDFNVTNLNNSISNNTILNNSTVNNITNLNSTFLQNSTTFDNQTAKNQTIFNSTFSNNTTENSTVISNNTLVNNNNTNNPINNSSTINNSTNSYTLIQCYGYTINDSRVCSGNGICISNNSCSCTQSYEGLNCETKKISCFGKYQADPSSCSGHGTCISADTCKCNAGYFGSKCSALLSAQPNFNSLGNTVEFHFNISEISIPNGVVECSKIVYENTLSLLGSNPSCYWKDGNFFIELGGQYSLTPHLNISLNVMALDNINTQQTSIMSLLILPSTNPVKPFINVSYKNVISPCEEIAIDASKSYCGDLKPVKFIWSIESSPDPNFNLQQLSFADLNSNLKSNGLSISGSYIFGLIVESSLSGARSDKKFIEISKSSVPNPTLSLLTSKLSLNNIEKSSLPVIVKKSIELPSCYFDNKEFKYTWSQVSGPSIEYHVDNNNDLVVSGISENGNDNYIFMVKAVSLLNSNSNDSMLIPISSKSAELSLNVYVSNLHPDQAEIGVEYSDPDNIVSVSESWNWSCLDRISNQACQDSVISGILTQCSSSKSTLCVIPKSTLSKVSLTLSVSKGVRFISKLIDIDFPISKLVIPPVISLISVTPNRFKVLKEEILSLQYSVVLGGDEKLTSEQDMIREWSINGNPFTSSMTSKMSTDISISSSLILSLSELLENGEYEINFKVTDIRNKLSSSLSYKFKVVKSPKSCLCTINPSTGYALETQFSFSCPGCQNAEQSIDFIFGFKDDKSGTKIPLYNLGEKFASYLPSPSASSNLDTFVDIVDLDTGASVEFIKPVEIKTPTASTISQVKIKVKAWSSYAASLLPSDSSKLIFNSATISRTSEQMIAKLSKTSRQTTDIAYELREDMLDSMILGLNQRNPLELLSDIHFRVYVFGLESLASNVETVYSLPFDKLFNMTEKVITMANQNVKFRVADGVDKLCNSLLENMIRLLATGSKEKQSYAKRLLDSMKKFNSLVLRNYYVGQKEYKVSFNHFTSISLLNYKNQLVKKTLTSDGNCTALINGIGSDISNRVVLETSMISTDDSFGVSDILQQSATSQIVKISDLLQFEVTSSYKLLSQIVSLDKKYNSDMIFMFNLGNYNISNVNVENKVDQKTEIRTIECVPIENILSQRNQSCITSIFSLSVHCNCSKSVTALVVIEKTISNSTLTTQSDTNFPTVVKKKESNLALYGLFGLFGLLAVCCCGVVMVVIVVLCLRKRKSTVEISKQKDVELLTV